MKNLEKSSLAYNKQKFNLALKQEQLDDFEYYLSLILKQYDEGQIKSHDLPILKPMFDNVWSEKKALIFSQWYQKIDPILSKKLKQKNLLAFIHYAATYSYLPKEEEGWNFDSQKKEFLQFLKTLIYSVSFEEMDFRAKVLDVIRFGHFGECLILLIDKGFKEDKQFYQDILFHITTHQNPDVLLLLNSLLEDSYEKIVEAIKNQTPDARSFVDLAVYNSSNAIYQQMILLGSRFKKIELDYIYQHKDIYHLHQQIELYHSILEKEKLDNHFTDVEQINSLGTQEIKSQKTTKMKI